MSFLTRLLNRFRIRRLERDLQDEVGFHLEMRARQYREHGLYEDDAMRRAREDFGDVKELTRRMRHARLSSMTTLLAMSCLLGGLLLFWNTREMNVPTDLQLPALPPPPLVIDLDPQPDSPPPPPPPPPTWEEFVAKVNTFGGGANDKKQAR